MLNFVLLDKYVSDPFTKVEIWYLKNLKFVLGRFSER